MRTTTARTSGLSRCRRRSRTRSSTSRMTPSSSTIATWGPKAGAPPSAPRIDASATRNSTRTPSQTAPTSATSRSGRLVFVVVVVVVLAALAAALATASPTAPLVHLARWFRGDRVVQLLQRQSDAPLVRIDADDEQSELVADAHHLACRRDRPIGHLRDVEQPVDPGLELHERAEVGETDHLPGDAGAHRIAGRRGRPRIRLDLLQPE